MVNEKLISFILKARTNKRSNDQIMQQLLSVGWKQAAISEAFAEIDSKNFVAPGAAAPAALPQQPAQSAPPWVKPEAPVQQPTVQPQQIAQAAPPWVKPEAAPQQPAAQAMPSQPSQAASLPAAQVAPPWVAQPTAATPAPPPIQPPLQQVAQPIIQMPQIAPAAQQPPPPAKQIDLESSGKKSFFSFLFGKKPSPAPMQSQVAGTAASAQQAPGQTTFAQPEPTPAVPLQGQSTLPTFAPGAAAPAQQGAAPSQSPPIALKQPSEQGAIMKLLPIIAFFALLALAAGAYYVLVMLPAQNAEPIVPSPPISPPIQNATPQNQTAFAAEPINCDQNDYACMAQSSEECMPAIMASNRTIDLFGMLVTSNGIMEIRKAEDGKCSLYTETTSTNLKFSDLFVATAIARGTPLNDIKKQEQSANLQAQATNGLNGTCKFNTSDLVQLFDKWEAGHMSSDDYKKGTCSGKLFANGGESPFTLPIANATVAKANNTIPSANTTVKANTTPPANTTVKANTTKPANATIIPPAAKANSTNASSAQNATSFKYSKKFTTYFPERLSRFCEDRDMAFYRMHYQEYYGGECSNEKPKDGYLNITAYAAIDCASLPCCINGPYSEYSISYDYFECGYN